MFIGNVLMPQLFLVRAFRRNVWTVYLVAMCANAGMWFERFAIIAVSLHRDFFAFELANVLSDLGRYLHVCGHDRSFPHPVSTVHQVLADGGDVGGKKCPA